MMLQVTGDPTLYDTISSARVLVRKGDVAALRALLIRIRRQLKQSSLSSLADHLACFIKVRPARAKDETIALIKLMAELEIPIEDSFYATDRPFHAILTAVGAGVVPPLRRILSAVETWNSRKVNAFIGALWKHQREYIISVSVKNFISWGDSTLVRIFFPMCEPRMFLGELLAVIKPCLRREFDGWVKRYEKSSNDEDCLSSHCRSDISTLYRKITALTESCWGENSPEAARAARCVDDQLTALFVAYEMTNTAKKEPSC